MRFLVLAIIALFGIHGISLWAGSGQVIESENGKPLQGVYVMAMWHASAFNPVDSRTVCSNFAITQTDKDGQYSLPVFSWRGVWPLFSDRQRYKEFYMAGYENFSGDDLTGAVIKMRRSTETVEKRLQSFLHQRYTNCTSEGEREKKLGTLYKAQLDEAKSIATSGADVSYVNTAGYRDTFVNTLTRRWHSATLPADSNLRNADGTLK